MSCPPDCGCLTEAAHASVNNSTASVFVTLLADSGVYPDWAKVGASDSEPSEGEELTLSSEMDNADLESGDSDFGY